MKGAAATSVEICAVTEIKSADGIAASRTQRVASRQVGAGTAASSSVALCVVPRGERSISAPHQAINAISTRKKMAQVQRCWLSVVKGSTANGYEISARKLPILLAAYKKYGFAAAG